MIDFRYHLISLITVILALALGILAGSGFLGGPLLARLNREVKGLHADNNRLQAEIGKLDDQIDQGDAFASAVAPTLTRGKLAGEEIVVVRLARTDDRVVEGTREALLDAGAQLITEVTLTDKFALENAPARDELALIVGSVIGEDAELIEEAASLIGERAASAASDASRTDSPSGGVAQQRFESLMGDLEEAGFLSHDTTEAGPSISPGSAFVVMGGSVDRPPFPPGPLVTALSEGLASRNAPTIVVEGSQSRWGLVLSIRDDIEARTGVATVDNAETVPGRVAAVLGLDRAIAGEVGHFGVLAGRTSLIPNPSG